MPDPAASSKPYNVLAVVQAGRLEYEAVLFAASFRAANPDFQGRLIFAEPQPGPKWPEDPRISDTVRAALHDAGAEVLPFTNTHFGADYPQGNKIEALRVLPADAPFVFFDTDTLHLSALAQVPFDFSAPSASMKREATWPVIELYGPGYHETWGALYDQFGLDFASSLNPDFPDEYWERYLYFNAGWFFGADPVAFADAFVSIATQIRDTPPKALECQPLYPWLDQIALPLVIHKLGGGRPTFDGLLDGYVTCHYRVLSLLFARESDAVVETLRRVAEPNKIKKVLKEYEPFKRMIYQAKGEKARALFDRDDLPAKEQKIRNRLKNHKLWLR